MNFCEGLLLYLVLIMMPLRGLQVYQFIYPVLFSRLCVTSFLCKLEPVCGTVAIADQVNPPQAPTPCGRPMQRHTSAP